MLPAPLGFRSLSQTKGKRDPTWGSEHPKRLSGGLVVPCGRKDQAPGERPPAPPGPRPCPTPSMWPLSQAWRRLQHTARWQGGLPGKCRQQETHVNPSARPPAELLWACGVAPGVAGRRVPGSHPAGHTLPHDLVWTKGLVDVKMSVKDLGVRPYRMARVDPKAEGDCHKGHTEKPEGDAAASHSGA